MWLLQIVITAVACAWITFMIPTDPDKNTPILGVSPYAAAVLKLGNGQ